MLVGMRGRMHQFILRALSAARWREVLAFNARYFESCRAIAFFYDLVDAGSFDNAAGLMDFGHLTPLLKWLCTFSKGHADRQDLSIPQQTATRRCEMRPGGKTRSPRTVGREPTRCDGQDSRLGICCEEIASAEGKKARTNNPGL